jgi:hypothetical protein
VVITRRGLVAAGAGVLVAGCGAPEPIPPDSELLGAVLGLERTLIGAYARVEGPAGRALADRAREHAARLARAGASPASEPPSPPEGEPLVAALALQRRSVGACLTAVGLVREPAGRALVAEILTAGAQHAAILRTRLGRDPLQTAFPDGRTA